MSEGRWKLNAGPVPRSVRPSSRVLNSEHAEAPCGLLVNKLGNRQAGSRRLEAWSNPRAEVVVRSDGLAPYLGNAERGMRRAKAFRVLALTFTTLVL
jgi:hypothetical protein